MKKIVLTVSVEDAEHLGDWKENVGALVIYAPEQDGSLRRVEVTGVDYLADLFSRALLGEDVK